MTSRRVMGGLGVRSVGAFCCRLAFVLCAASDDAFELGDENQHRRLKDQEMVNVNIYQVTILMVGAGRGPLVREAIGALIGAVSRGEAIGAVSRVSALWMQAANKEQ